MVGIPNIADLGCDPTGVADCTAALAAAWTVSKELWVPPGFNFKFSDTTQPAIVVPPGGKLMGAGLGSKLTFANGGQGCLCLLGDGAEAEGLGFDCTAKTSGWTIQAAGYAVRVTNITATNPVEGVRAYALNNLTLDTIRLQNLRGTYGYWYQGATDGTHSDVLNIRNCMVQGNFNNPDSIGLFWSDGAQTLRVDSVALLGLGYGFRTPLADGRWGHPQYAKIAGLETDGIMKISTWIGSGEWLKFSDSWLQNSSRKTGPQGGADSQAVLIEQGLDRNTGYDIHTVKNLTFGGCHFGASRGPGFMSHGRQIALANCFSVPAETTPVNPDNTGVYSAFTMAPGAQDHTLNGCHIYEDNSPVAWAHGVEMQAGSHRTVAVGNTFTVGSLDAPVYIDPSVTDSLAAANL